MGVPIFFKTSDKVWSLLGYLLWRILLTLPYSVLYMITRRRGNRDFYFRVGLIIWRQNLMIFFITLPKRTTMDINKGAAFKAHPYEDRFRDHFDPFFLHRKGWGTNIRKENFFKNGFETKKCHFYVHFAWTLNFEKVIKKTTQNIPKQNCC